NQIPDMSGFTKNLASNGWQKLPSGLIFQWISTIATSPTNGVDATIWWPTAFPNACLMVQATFSEGSAPFTDITMPIFITGRSRSNVTVRSYAGLANTIDIFAIGY
ncbi:gp53-like domain-containing protein, partial [Leminorella grimontii]|uniref:gp53-like domain-containing protein n=1 Tax=Leminorella grimontii TaxID=82981 RepID=UPI004039127F